MKFSKILFFVCFFCSANSFSQSLMDTAIDGNIKTMHSTFKKSHFSKGIFGNDKHPRILADDYQDLERSVEEAKKISSEAIKEISILIDKVVKACEGRKLYSDCKTNSCRKSVRSSLKRCESAQGLYESTDKDISAMENLYVQSHSDKVPLALKIKSVKVNTVAISAKMKINHFLLGQNLLLKNVATPVDIDNKLTKEQKRIITLNNMKRAWAKTSELLGCNGEAIDQRYETFANTTNFIETVCVLAVNGSLNGYVTQKDFIELFEPGLDLEVYVNFNR